MYPYIPSYRRGAPELLPGRETGAIPTKAIPGDDIFMDVARPLNMGVWNPKTLCTFCAFLP